jgi:hypothetical protein
VAARSISLRVGTTIAAAELGAVPTLEAPEYGFLATGGGVLGVGDTVPIDGSAHRLSGSPHRATTLVCSSS